MNQQVNGNQDQPEKLGWITGISVVYAAVQLVSVALGHYEKMTANFGVTAVVIIVMVVAILMMLRRKWLRRIAAAALIWAVIATGLLVYVGNKFVAAVPITVTGTVISNDLGVPIFACIEVHDENRNPVTQNQGNLESNGSFSIYNLPSGKYRLFVNGKWVSNFTVPRGYWKLFFTGFSGKMDLEPEPVDAGTDSTPTSGEEDVPFVNPGSAQAFRNSCEGTPTTSPERVETF